MFWNKQFFWFTAAFSIIYVAFPFVHGENVIFLWNISWFIMVRFQIFMEHFSNFMYAFYGLPFWWEQLGVVYYELLILTETITGDRYRTQLMRMNRALKDKWPQYNESMTMLDPMLRKWSRHTWKPVSASDRQYFAL